MELDTVAVSLRLKVSQYMDHGESEGRGIRMTQYWVCISSFADDEAFEMKLGMNFSVHCIVSGL